MADLTASEAASVRSRDGQPADWATPFVLRNVGRSTCQLGGWAGIAFFGDSMIVICPTPAQSCRLHPDTTTPRPVDVTRSNQGTPGEIVLTPGTSTFFTLVWTVGFSSNFCTQTTPTVEPYSVQIRVPGDNRPLTVILTADTNLQLCNARAQITAFGITG